SPSAASAWHASRCRRRSSSVRCPRPRRGKSRNSCCGSRRRSWDDRWPRPFGDVLSFLPLPLTGEGRGEGRRRIDDTGNAETALTLPSPGGRGFLRAAGWMVRWFLVLLLEADDFVFYSQLLTLEIGDRRGVRQGAADLFDDLAFDMGVPGTKRFD